MTMALLTVASPAQAGETFVVNSTGDAGDVSPSGVCNTAPFAVGVEPECTLRAALEEANATTDFDAIFFNIGGPGVKTISPGSSLPTITEPVIIDGYSEPGTELNTLAVGNNATILIRLDGIDAPDFVNGLSITTDNTIVLGLSITRFNNAIDISGPSADHVILGNFLGLTPAGLARGNRNGLILSASSSVVGGTTPDTRNIISANGSGSNSGGFGIVISNDATDNQIMGNYIGTKKNGSGDLGNRGPGLFIANGASGNVIGDRNPGDGATNAANVVAFNSIGLGIATVSSTGNTILRNSIFSNSLLGIDLDVDGVTPNDTGDPDPGANNLQNFPVLSSAMNGARTRIEGRLRSTANGTFAIQLFKSPEGTKDEGKRYIGQKIVADKDGDGIVAFTFRLQNKVRAGMFVTATATNDVTGDTSEFSAPKRVRTS